MEVTNFLLVHNQGKSSFEQTGKPNVGAGSLVCFGSSANANQVASAGCWCLLAGISERWFATCKFYGLEVPIER